MILGHRWKYIEGKGAITYPNREKLIRLYSSKRRPNKLKELQALFGAINYFRSYIPDFARIAKPISQQLKVKGGPYWTPEMEEAYHRIEQLLYNTALVAFDDKKETFLFVDASEFALGGFLCQANPEYKEGTGDDKYLPVAFNSRVLHGTETTGEIHWSIPKKEFAAIVYNLRYYHVYLVGRHFTLFSDSKICVDTIKNCKTEGMQFNSLSKWLDVFQDYNFTIAHISGIENFLPDRLTRLICDKEYRTFKENKHRFTDVVIEDIEDLETDVNIMFVNPDKLSLNERDRLLRQVTYAHEFGHYGAGHLYRFMKNVLHMVVPLKLIESVVDTCKQCRDYTHGTAIHLPQRNITAH